MVKVKNFTMRKASSFESTLNEDEVLAHCSPSTNCTMSSQRNWVISNGSTFEERVPRRKSKSASVSIYIFKHESDTTIDVDKLSSMPLFFNLSLGCVSQSFYF